MLDESLLVQWLLIYASREIKGRMILMSRSAFTVRRKTGQLNNA